MYDIDSLNAMQTCTMLVGQKQSIDKSLTNGNLFRMFILNVLHNVCNNKIKSIGDIRKTINNELKRSNESTKQLLKVPLLVTECYSCVERLSTYYKDANMIGIKTGFLEIEDNTYLIPYIVEYSNGSNVILKTSVYYTGVPRFSIYNHIASLCKEHTEVFDIYNPRTKFKKVEGNKKLLKSLAMHFDLALDGFKYPRKNGYCTTFYLRKSCFEEFK